MTIQQYFDKINNFALAENKMQHYKSSDLESLILKILPEADKIYFRLDALFQNSAHNVFAINPEVIALIKDRSGLVFIDEKGTGNVCFINNEELRPEFKQNYTAIDLLDFSYAILHSSIYKKDLKSDNQKIPIPLDSDVFWRLVQIGSDIRKKESK
ncbi:type ISP restriction/modification enzyme [uncultured Flavobacterium sp.]|uniref:type ISP restriction/modification enzyme n=1 Tax=uncultured Flavobacterium sp. TaxID=165435 RepID=UPI00292F6DDA|nr:type ISP restriction/modification enzyme [uncultured Flavobacterium sp.]